MQFKMESYLATSLYLGILLPLSMMEPIARPPFPFGFPPPPFGMTPDDFSKYPFPFPPPFAPPSSTVQSESPPSSSIIQSASSPSSSTVQSASPSSSSTVQSASPSSSSTVQSASPPPSKTDDEDGFDITAYAYDKAGLLAREIYRLVHTSDEEFLGTHMYFMLESPTAKAVSEYMNKIKYAKDNGGEDCLADGEENEIKDFRKRHAEVVWNCEAGWKRNVDFVDKARTLLNAVGSLDLQAQEALKDCKPGQACYDKFRRSTLAASIDKQLKEIRRNQLIDLRVLANEDHVISLYSIYKCNADMSDPVRKDIYTSIAKLNVCISTVGLITTM